MEYDMSKKPKKLRVEERVRQVMFTNVGKHCYKHMLMNIINIKKVHVY